MVGSGGRRFSHRQPEQLCRPTRRRSGVAGGPHQAVSVHDHIPAGHAPPEGQQVMRCVPSSEGHAPQFEAGSRSPGAWRSPVMIRTGSRSGPVRWVTIGRGMVPRPRRPGPARPPPWAEGKALATAPGWSGREALALHETPSAAPPRISRGRCTVEATVAAAIRPALPARTPEDFAAGCGPWLVCYQQSTDSRRPPWWGSIFELR